MEILELKNILNRKLISRIAMTQSRIGMIEEEGNELACCSLKYTNQKIKRQDIKWKNSLCIYVYVFYMYILQYHK